MHITFTCFGLSFEAEATYYPGRPGVQTLRNGDPGYPAEADDIELSELVCEGRDAESMLDYSDVINAALVAAREVYQHQADDYQADIAENRAYMREWGI